MGDASVLMVCARVLRAASLVAIGRIALAKFRRWMLVSSLAFLEKPQITCRS
jgi:hypothetical protein